jgi:hypothetical protein
VVLLLAAVPTDVDDVAAVHEAVDGRVGMISSPKISAHSSKLLLELSKLAPRP